MTVNKIIFILLFISLIACEKKDEWEKRYTHLSNRQIDLPTSLMPLNDFSKNYTINNKTNLLIGLFACSCPTCARNLTKWRNVVKELDNSKVEFFLVMYDDVDPYVKSIINREYIVNYPVFFDDKKGDFIHNNILLYAQDNTLLLKDGRVKFIGNILNNKQQVDEINFIMNNL